VKKADDKDGFGCVCFRPIIGSVKDTCGTSPSQLLLSTREPWPAGVWIKKRVGQQRSNVIGCLALQRSGKGHSINMRQSREEYGEAK